MCCVGDAAAELEKKLTALPAEARLFYRQLTLHNPDTSFNWIVDEAEQEFGMTFTNDMTPRARLVHDILFECERAANVGGVAAAATGAAAGGDTAAAGAAAAASDAAAAGAPTLSLSLCKCYAKLCVPGEGAVE